MDADKHLPSDCLNLPCPYLLQLHKYERALTCSKTPPSLLEALLELTWLIAPRDLSCIELLTVLREFGLRRRGEPVRELCARFGLKFRVARGGPPIPPDVCVAHRSSSPRLSKRGRSASAGGWASSTAPAEQLATLS
eukprot:6190295-Pleurochrysis_carterae.AAC.2